MNLALKVEKIQNFLELKFKDEALKSYSIKNEELEFKRNELGNRVLIGRGVIGNVYLGEYNGTEVAIKEIYINNLEMQKEQVLKEIEVMLMIRHTNYCLIYGYVDMIDCIYIVTEYYIDGNLQKALINYDIKIDEKRKKSWLLQIAKGMNYLHSRNIMHRDLKSANIFLTNEHSKAVIGDFGLTKHIYSRYENHTNLCDSIGWMAPETIKKNGKYSTPADIYSFGIVMYEVLARCLPYKDMNGIKERVIEGERPDISMMNQETDYKLILLMKRCWDPIPERRPTFSEIITYLSS